MSFFKNINQFKIILILALFALLPPLLSQTRKSPVKKAITINANQEFDLISNIAQKENATYQDLADMIVIQRNEFDKYPSALARIKRVSELGFFDFSEIINPPQKKINYGAVAKAVLNAHDLEKGMMFKVFGWQRYALKDCQSIGIISREVSVAQDISGNDLMGVLDAALKERKKAETWGVEKNYYADFGFKSYAEMAKAADKQLSDQAEAKGKKGQASAKESAGSDSSSTPQDFKEPNSSVAVKGGQVATVSSSGGVTTPQQLATKENNVSVSGAGMTAAESTSLGRETDVTVGTSSSDLQDVFNTITEVTQPQTPVTPTASELQKL